jgi:hypothetical protein
MGKMTLFALCMSCMSGGYGGIGTDARDDDDVTIRTTWDQ